LNEGLSFEIELRIFPQLTLKMSCYNRNKFNNEKAVRLLLFGCLAFQTCLYPKGQGWSIAAKINNKNKVRIKCKI